MSWQLELLLFVTGVLLASQVSQHSMAGWVGGQKLHRPTCLFACMAAIQTGIGQKPSEGRWLGQLTGTVRNGTEESPSSSLDECKLKHHCHFWHSQLSLEIPCLDLSQGHHQTKDRVCMSLSHFPGFQTP